MGKEDQNSGDGNGEEGEHLRPTMALTISHIIIRKIISSYMGIFMSCMVLFIK